MENIQDSKGKEVLDYEEGPKTVSQEIATRKNAQSFYNVLGALPNPDPVLRKKNASIEVYRELRGDAKLQAVLGSRKAGVKKYRTNLDENDSDPRLVELIQEYITKDLDLYSLIDEILEASEYGYKPFELLWEYNRGYLLPTAYPKDDKGKPLHSESNGLIGKPPEWFEYSPDNHLLFRREDSPEGEPVPDRKFVVARRRATYANPYGEAILAACFWPVIFKKNGLRFWNIFVEKYGMPFMLGTFKRGAQDSEKNSLLDALESMVQDAIGAIPEGSSVEMIERKGGGGGNQEFKGIAEYMDKQISQAILGQNLTSDVSSGSLAAAEVHEDVKEEIIGDDAKIVESFMNDVFKYIRDVNFPDSNYPKLTLESPKGVDKELSERDKNLKELGVDFNKSYFQKVYKLEEEDFEVSKGESTPAATSSAANFNEKEEPEFNDQNAVDAFMNSFKAKEMNEFSEELLKPIFEIVKDSNDYAECMERIGNAYPQMSSDMIEATLGKALFVTESFGNLSNE